MRIDTHCIHGSDFSVCTDNIGTFKSIISKECYSFCMGIYSHIIHRSNCSVSVDIALQMYLHILSNILRTHCDGVLSRDMVIFHHLHGVGAGGNARDGVVCGVALNEDLIVCLGVALGNQLKNDVIGIATEAGGRAGNGNTADSGSRCRLKGVAQVYRFVSKSI